MSKEALNNLSEEINKKQLKFIVEMLLSLILHIIGLGLIVWQSNWIVAVGIFLVIWANNISKEKLQYV